MDEGEDVQSTTHTWDRAAELGRRIIAADPYRPGEVISLLAVAERLDVSRAMAREILQVLHQKRLVKLQPRVGATVLPVDRWDVFDPDVLSWRLDIAPRFPMRSLTELRRAVEPGAAGLAAQRASADICRDLVALSRKLADLGRDETFQHDDEAGRHCRQQYLDVDVEFHRTLLRGSGNEMFRALDESIEKALTHRIERDWAGLAGGRDVADRSTLTTTPFPRRPEEIALWLHRGLALAVEQGLPEAAEAFAAAILDEIRPRGLRNPVLRHGLRRGLDQLDPDGFPDPTEWTGFRAAVDEYALEIPVVVMGVAGCGKTSVGRLLATQLGATFVEADDLHPPANKEKMSSGTPLTDQDRAPWLEEVAGRIRDHADQGVVVSCSALKRSYRDILRGGHPGTWFLHLDLDRDTATRRVGSRPGHFMPASLVASQFEALEPLDRDEAGLRTDATVPVAEIVGEARTRLRR